MKIKQVLKFSQDKILNNDDVNEMSKKLISSILVVALMNLLGCYSSELVTAAEYKQVEEKDGKPNEIYVKTKDYQGYHFSESNFYIDSDTLYGKVMVRGMSFEGKFAFWEIESIQLEDFGQKHPSLMTVSQYQKIEVESGKPDEIYLTKNDSTRYHFMKNDYYIKNDILYGKGKLIIDREQQLDRKIALLNIESIQFEYFNGAASTLLVLGFLVIPIVVVLAIVKISPPSFGFKYK